MKGGITKRIEDTVKALEQGQLKKALYLSEAKGLEKHHNWIEDAARFCLANKEDKNACDSAVKEARERVQSTVTLLIDDTSLEGLEEYLTEQNLPEEKRERNVRETEEKPQEQKTDEEMYEECEECHVAVAASTFADVCAEERQEAGPSCDLISQKLEDETTEPVDWIKAMVQTAESAQGKAKEQMVETVTELTDYLERRKSPLLEKLNKEEKNG